MSGDTAAHVAEIVIVKRRGDDSGHGGSHGAWKIAYADFVTAMMAFFLVMWLINASNEATRAQVASYFNPIKLTDSSTGRRGLRENKDGNASPADKTQKTSGLSNGSTDSQSEEALLANPVETLDNIASGKKTEAGTQGVGQPGVVPEPALSSPADSINGGKDPFDPRTWDNVRGSPVAAAAEMQRDATIVAAPPVSVTPAGVAKPEAAVKSGEEIANPSAHEAAPVPSTAPVAEKGNPRTREAAAIAEDIARRMGKTGLDELPASIDVKTVEEGILISLTDKQAFGMFKSGSAEPELRMVELVGAIAGALADREGFVVIRGHTDSRPFRNKKYDNWQLSTARAHFAQYMLVRGGLEEKRIRRVEGVADRQPRNPDDPQAAENRRIEILLGRDSP